MSADDRERSSGGELTRRDVIKLGAAATLGASLDVESLAGQTAVPVPAAPRTFFTPEELALVDELSEAIIPADDHSPGAKAAKVAAYIDSRLAEAWDQQEKTMWRGGLRLVEQLASELGGKSFVQSTAQERTAVLTKMAQNEAKPVKPEELFFAELKSRVVRAYYTSEIGIRQEIEYKGNSYLAEFEGFDVSSPSGARLVE